MFDVDDLHEKAGKKRHTIACSGDLSQQIDEFKKAFGKRKTAEIIRRAIAAGLAFADKELRKEK
jgi:hypothetical protein